MRRQFAGLGAVLAGFTGVLLSACGDPTGHTGTLRELQVARSRWSRVYATTGQPVSAGHAEYFPAVEGMFDLIRAAAAEGAARLETEYHPVLGYPIRVFIDHQLEAADDEVTYALSNFLER